MPQPRIALISALAQSPGPAMAAMDEAWPQARYHNLIDDSLAGDLASAQRVLGKGLGVLEPHGTGARLRGNTDNFDWLAAELAALPFPFKVKSPHGLRAAVREIGQRLMSAAE